MKKEAEIFQQIIDERRSVRVYDAEAPFDEGAVKRSLERAVLSPSSSNMQLWEFYRVKSNETLKKLSEACFNQSAARTAREMIVIVVRRDKWAERKNFNLQKVREFAGPEPDKRGNMAIDYYKKLIPFVYTHDPLGFLGLAKQSLTTVLGLFRTVPRENTRADARVGAHKSAALAAMTFMYSIKAEGYDTCPMEGFDSKKVKKAVGLPYGAEVNMVISVGVAKPEGTFNPRWRVDNSEVIFEK